MLPVALMAMPSHARILAGTSHAKQQLIANSNRISSLPEINQSVLVCNAYAHRKPLAVVRMRSQLKVTTEPLAYKSCTSAVVPLVEQDEFQFILGDYEIGTFLAGTIPELSTTLLLVARRRNNLTMQASFESHKFKELQNAQVVLIDAYNGDKNGPVLLADNPEIDTKSDNLRDAPKKVERRLEQMAYNTVRTVSPGHYLLRLPGGTKEYQMNVSSSPSKTIVLHVGTDDGSADSTSRPFPEELALFQSSGYLASPAASSLLFVAFVAMLSAAFY